MFFTILLHVLVGLSFSSSVKTSLCCCGCTVEPCPQVGPYCPVPQQECESPMDLQCKELQQLWDESHGKDTKVTSSSLQEVLTTTTPIFQGAHSGEQNAFWRAPNLTSPGVRNDGISAAIGLRETDASVYSTDDRRATLERFQSLISEMQQVLSKVKQVVVDQPIHRLPFMVNKDRPYRGSISDEMEKKVVDDVIQRLRGSFSAVKRGDLRPLTEVNNKFVEYAEVPMS